ncbi:DnaJ domain containing protein [Entamoeba histolytica HM-1:IMSS-B]|uniref:DnaJ domain containing protein n=4 Tax=Entamoeba histolytica TaxID=5759 RepID=C4LV80_ENTH1|nr:DnaJ domain containing protein [Entamoeba histolytica HM-1:IMSS]EAL49580.1 DnaJ domain containing protein [Entamoeba histolytica HM-1:IMSS]EMH76752.1 DnaJ domain containing protein [Entamoeba histolytica HM-1:IMSS-B]EMS10952.1 DnaJ domain containing protein [Entamoeba histolytica HM-3:IMSS]GAT92567.1 DNAj domain containing protein [Entamoeba histolytica]|eukprot:XP_654969.1 DnaJ domain containing protein [Entamoeba histolytica HM-1:IMSS]
MSDGINPPEIDKLLTQITTYKNPFNVIGVLPEDDNDTIHKKYRKISLKCHPDRCHHPLSNAAISCLSKAIKAIEDEDQRKKYTDLMEQARIQLMTELKNKGELSKINTNSDEYRQLLCERCEKIMAETEIKLEKAEKIRQANLKREKEELQHQEEIQKLQKQQEEDWENSRQQRFNNWRSFMSKKNKTLNSNEHKPIKPPKATLMN